MKTILEEAAELTSGARQDVYGHPAENYTDLAEVWTTLLRRNGILAKDKILTAEDAQVLLIAMKVVRLAKDPTHRDSIIDVAGYARTLEMSLDKFYGRD